MDVTSKMWSVTAWKPLGEVRIVGLFGSAERAEARAEQMRIDCPPREGVRNTYVAVNGPIKCDALELHGIAMAARWLAERDQPSLALDLLSGFGLGLGELTESGVCEEDMLALERAGMWKR